MTRFMSKNKIDQECSDWLRSTYNKCFGVGGGSVPMPRVKKKIQKEHSNFDQNLFY